MNECKLCPHCGNDTFMAYIKRGGLVRCDGVDENGHNRFTIIREGAKDNFDVEIIKCPQCKNTITEADLVNSAICKTCHKTVSPNELDENGNCAVCQLITANPEVENASKEDLLRMLAQAYRMNNSVANRLHAKAEKGKAIEAELTPVVANSATDSSDEGNIAESENMTNTESTAADDILNGKVPEDAVKPTRRRKARKTKTEEVVAEAPEDAQDDTETEDDINIPSDDNDAPEAPEDAQEGVIEESNDDTAPEEEVAQATTVIADTQTAPFPDVSNDIMMPDLNPSPVIDTQPAPSDTATSSGFKMFDGEEEEPF